MLLPALLLAVSAVGCGVTLTHPGSSSGPAAQSVYVVQNGSGRGATGSILRFAATANGSVAPEAVLTGPAGKDIRAVTVDTAGQIYVGACESDLTTCEVDIYPAGTSNTTAPVRTVTGGLTNPLSAVPSTFVGLSALAVDSSGNLYVTGGGSVFEFAPDATGLAVPTREFAPMVSRFTFTLSLALDPSRYVYLSTVTAGSANCQLLVLPPGASGATAPLRSITVGSALLNCPVATDTLGNVYVGSTTTNAGTGQQTTEIQKFAGGATGSSVPLRTIAGAITGLGYLPAIAADSAGYVYAVSGTLPPKSGSLSVDVFSPTANGNTAPISAFTSPSFNDYTGTQLGLF